MKCGLLGRKLGHSYSPQIHALLGDYSYDLFEREPEDIGQFLLYGDFDAINVTIPYKKAVIPYLDRVDDIARRLGSVNTIVRRADGSLDGYNTDYYGFCSMVARSALSVAGRKALVLGTGGASATAQAVLADLGAHVVVISRSGENNYNNLDRHRDAAVIVNTTPVGMYPNTGVAALECAQFPKLEGALDVVYNPSRTQLLLDGEKRGLITENGLWMLVAQAKLASEHFTGKKLSDGVIETIYHQLKQQMENIVLVGMPGCGKSTIGTLLAKKTGKTFADSDELIIKMAGMSIPEIFARHGEEVFREYETKALAELGKQSGLVIATGGGCVTKERNHPLLHQNGTIVWVRRDLERLPTDGRPLSQSQKLMDMYQTRKSLYESFADAAVDNDGTVEETVKRIISIMEERK